jgi:phosphoesterase RecJ-like protein
VVADLVAQGVEPERVYRDVFASVPLRRMRLLQRALGNLEHDPDYRITWCVIDRSVMEQTGTGNEDLDGVVDTIRTVRGTEVAILFRETADGSTKISLRSSGDANVNAIAREFGGGGHVKASGALIARPLADTIPAVLESTRAALRESEPGFRIDRRQN